MPVVIDSFQGRKNLRLLLRKRAGFEDADVLDESASDESGDAFYKLLHTEMLQDQRSLKYC